ncbi:MAG: hypothetical protein LBB58_03450 [Cellulomonadaceae bacterium]|jgi:hypothetical protein|nr:hypothetical protein [Cellulomonadaceae bacterium]
MLGRIERESPVHAALAAQAGGWSATAPSDAGTWDSAPTLGEEILDLGGMTDTFSAVAELDELAAVVQIANPEAPDPLVEDYLLRGEPTLMLVAAQAVTPEWVWVRSAEAARADSGRFVIVDEAGLRDARETLRSFGVPLRVVSGRMSVAERLENTGFGGSLVLERSRVPHGLTEVPGSQRLADLPQIWYGLVDSRLEPPTFERPAQIWLAFGPSNDRRGSLSETLQVFAGLDLNLTHLRSQREPGRPHHFYSAFRCPTSDVLNQLRAALTDMGVKHRVLAVLPGSDFRPAPVGLTPRWS